MNDHSILDSVKTQIPLDLESTEFDNEVIMRINSNLFILGRIGVPITGKHVVDRSQTYSDIFDTSLIPLEILDGINTYLGCKVRLSFDTPSSNAVIEVLKEIVKETEWTLNTFFDTNGYKGGDDTDDLSG